MNDPLGLINAQRPQGIAPPRPPAGPDGTGHAGATNGPEFKDVLLQNLKQVDALQQEAQTAIEDVVAGKRDDMAAVLTAKQKADVAFQMLLQVRNKMMDAYEEVKQIRV
ncbi:MAG: flagellar hook-basal body complex protein FliE [Planctomycetota bacterium]